MKILTGSARQIIVIAMVAVLLGGSASAQWTDISSPDVMEDLYGMHFLSSDTGYVVGWRANVGQILKTTDGGVHWDRFRAQKTLLFATHFQDVKNGVVVGYFEGCICALILRTTDGGLNWAAQTYSGSLGLYDLAATGDGRTIYAGGYQGAILKTTDGGLNWGILESGSDDVFRLIKFPTEQVGYAVAGEGTNYNQPTKVYRTTNAGTTWELVKDFAGSPILGGIAFTSAEVGHGAGWDGTAGIFKTTDRGETWRRTYSGLDTVVVQGIYFTDRDHGYAVGDDGLALKTTDGGETWAEVERFSDKTFLGVTVVGDAEYAIGVGGAIYKTTLGPVSAVPGAVATTTKQFVVRDAAGSITIQPANGTARPYSVQLFDVSGNQIYQAESASGSMVIPTEGIATGMYIYSVQYETERGKTTEEGVVAVQ